MKPRRKLPPMPVLLLPTLLLRQAMLLPLLAKQWAKLLLTPLLPLVMRLLLLAKPLLLPAKPLPKRSRLPSKG